MLDFTLHMFSNTKYKTLTADPSRMNRINVKKKKNLVTLGSEKCQASKTPHLCLPTWLISGFTVGL